MLSVSIFFCGIVIVAMNEKCFNLSIYIKRLRRRVCMNARNSKTTERIFMRFSPMDAVIREEGLGV